jgi:hypothetical protein
MSIQSWMECVSVAEADGTAVANTTTETILFPNVTVAGGYLKAGRVLRGTLRGRWANVVTAVPTMTFRTRWGGVAGTVLQASPAVVTPATATTAAMWKMAYEMVARLSGATGSLFTMGDLSLFEDAAATFGTVLNYGVVQPMGSAGVATPAAVTVDLTVDQALSDTLTWSAANAANTATGHIKLLESMV